MYLLNIKTCKRAFAAAFIALSASLTGFTASASTLHIANMGEPSSMDPHFVTGTWEHDVVLPMYEGLITYGQDGKPILGAAKSYAISNDGKTYTFKLRDHNWSDGVPITAQDFVFSFRRILAPETAAEYAYLLYPIKGAEAVNTGKAPPDTLGVKALDDKTLQIDLNNPRLILSSN